MKPFDEIMAEMDRWAASHNKRHGPWALTEIDPAMMGKYEFGIEQVRSEIEALAKVMYDLPTHDSILEIGLGPTAGTRVLWLQMFDHVINVERGQDLIDRWRETNRDGSPMICGLSGDPRVIEQVRELGPYNAIFFDGPHLYDDVKRDWENYAPLVTPGGIIAWHDAAADLDGHLSVASFMLDLKAAGLQIIDIHHSQLVGISYYREG